MRKKERKQEEDLYTMPIPNHCVECDKPNNNDDSWLCDVCLEKEEARKKNMVTTNKTGEDLKNILPSLNDGQEPNIRRG